MKRFRFAIAMILLLLLSLSLAWISSGYANFEGWGSFLAVLLISAGILWAGWWALRNESLPDWLGRLLLGAVILRLAAAVLWFVVLPLWGHGTEGELAGYIMSDAYQRDMQAWELSQTGKSLWSAFQDYRLADQYGGLLFLSAAIYRFLGGHIHQPLLITVITAASSSLVILFAWTFIRRLWGDVAAKFAAWILCLYPEAVLLGSSQMREAFMMTLAGIAFYGLVVYSQDRKMTGIVWMLGALLVSLPISYLFAVMMLVILILSALILNQAQLKKHWRLWVILGSLLVVGVVGIWFVGEKIYPAGASNPGELFHQWLVFAARWEERSAAISSGWLNNVFKRSPEWMNVWIILGYGVFQPFLPAALIAIGNWVWRSIAIWRAIGWTFLLVFLLYAPLRAVVKVKKNFLPAGICLLVWAGILVSAYRGGADQWDNPRYRVVWVALQVALAGWIWSKQRNDPDPWFKRVLIGTGWVFAWFIPWYLRRYSYGFTWSVIDLFKTLGLGFASAILYWLWDWARSQKIPDAR